MVALNLALAFMLGMFWPVSSYILVTDLQLINDYGAKADYRCPVDWAIARVWSAHSNHAEDRMWKVSCKPMPKSHATCKWGDYANLWDGRMDFKCPNHGMIAGINSHYQHWNRDRRYKFYCCDYGKDTTKNCRQTSEINWWDGVLDYNPGTWRFINGVSSYHSNYYEDRRFGFESCEQQ